MYVLFFCSGHENDEFNKAIGKIQKETPIMM